MVYYHYTTIILLLYHYYITIISLLYHYYITIISLLECHYYSILLSKALYHPICSTAATVAFSARLLPKRLMPKSRKQQMAWKVSSSRSALWRTVEMSWGMAGVVIVFYYGLLWFRMMLLGGFGRTTWMSTWDKPLIKRGFFRKYWALEYFRYCVYQPAVLAHAILKKWQRH